jgi:hypothetical protein
MARRKSTETPSTMRHAFEYTPGDHCRYTWSGGEHAAVERITVTDGRLTFAPTGDLVPMDNVARTASAFMARVDTWRQVVAP